MSYKSDRLSLAARHYKINDPISSTTSTTVTDAPPEEISGTVQYRLMKNWSAKYTASYDMDAGIARTQEASFIFNDDCTYLQLYYQKRRSDLGLVDDSAGFGVRISLLTLGETRQD